MIEQPDGCRVLLPAWMTESWAASLPTVEVPRLSMDSLRELRALVDAQVVSSAPSSETIRTAGDDDGTARTMPTTRSAGLATNVIQRQRLDPVARAEIVSLLKLLINECSAALAKAKGADDE
jgi:hypothetical protein